MERWIICGVLRGRNQQMVLNGLSQEEHSSRQQFWVGVDDELELNLHRGYADV